MDDLSLESLAKRVEALEKAVLRNPADVGRKDWRRAIGMFGDSEFMREVDEECSRALEAEREAVRRGEPAE